MLRRELIVNLRKVKNTKGPDKQLLNILNEKLPYTCT